MKVEYINPFIDGVRELFTTMLGCESQRGEVGLAMHGGGPEVYYGAHRA